MKKYLLTLSLFFLASLAHGQKYYITNQYVYDLFMVNPADAGSNRNCITFNGFYQKQWFGVDLAPTTQLLAFQSPLMNNLGSGTYVFNDRNGNFTWRGIQQSFSVEVLLRENRRGNTSLLYGLSAYLEQSSINYGNLTDGALVDPVFSGGRESGIGINANSGIILNVNTHQFGFAASNLFAQNNPMYKTEWEPRQGMDMHLHAGSSFKVPGRDIFLDPLLYFRFNNQAEKRLDANLKLYMPTLDPNVALWGILAYRRSMDVRLGKNMGLATTFGIDYKSFSLGIEHQLGLTPAQKQFGSAFVLVASYRICTKKGGAFPCTQEDAIIKAAQRDKNRGLQGIKDAGN